MPRLSLAAVLLVLLLPGVIMAQNRMAPGLEDTASPAAQTPVDELASGPADATNDLDDLDDFFESPATPLPDDSLDMGEAGAEPGDTDAFFIDGSIEVMAGFRLDNGHLKNRAGDPHDLSHAKGEIELELGTRLHDAWDLFVSGSAAHNLAYEINGRQDYTDGFLSDSENEIILAKAFVRGSLTDSLDVKIGRQIVVWGKSDNIRITDILNPMDRREPGLTDIEDL